MGKEFVLWQSYWILWKDNEGEFLTIFVQLGETIIKGCNIKGNHKI